MSILSRFKDIFAANINDLLDKAEDPAKMIDQYMRNMLDDLAEVKKETAGVMAEESRTKRLVDENAAQVAKYADLAKKALLEKNEDDARVFLTKKQELESAGAALQTASATAHENAVRMRQLHDKLTADIQTLNARREAIKAKVAVARTQDKVNTIAGSGDKANAAIDAFSRMEAKADSMLDRSNAMAELNSEAYDAATELEAKYKAADVNSSVEDELAKMKSDLGL